MDVFNVMDHDGNKITDEGVLHYIEKSLGPESCFASSMRRSVGVTSVKFCCIMSENSIWKYACLRNLEVSDPGNVGCKWTKLYASAFDRSHSFMFRHQEKYIGI